MPIAKRWSNFNKSKVAAVPKKGGIYELGDKRGLIIDIGSGNLRQRLQSHLNTSDPCKARARYFRYEQTRAYKCMEAQQIQRFIEKEGRPPTCNINIPSLRVCRRQPRKR